MDHQLTPPLTNMVGEQVANCGLPNPRTDHPRVELPMLAAFGHIRYRSADFDPLHRPRTLFELRVLQSLPTVV